MAAASPTTPFADQSIGARPRLDSVDLLRGLVMILMALDHTRDFVGYIRIDAMDIARTHPALYWTRWITHFCAPTFVFLAGASALLYGARGRDRGEWSHFLLTRGLWIASLEFTLSRFAWTFNLDYRWMWVQVIWVIGCSLVLLSFLVKFSPQVVGAIGIAIIALHNLTDSIGRAQLGSLYPVWSLLHVTDLLRPAEDAFFLVGYPLIPWFGIALAGYGFGKLLLRDAPERRRFMLRTGAALTIGFVVLRYLNFYGDPRPWSVQSDSVRTLFSFLNTTKYGPSLLYTLMTLGPALIFLGLLQGRSLPRWSRWVVTFGRVPLFYYILHIFVIHALAVVVAYVSYGDASFLTGNPPAIMGSTLPKDWGVSLPWVYASWFFVLALLYPLCVWFARLKQRSSARWLSYF